jgi:four helix bundle protein
MGVVRFEDLRVWQVAKCLCDEIGALIQRPSLQGDHAIKAQLNAATLSTMANIAEGFMRGGSKEFAQFVRIAAGSNGEARALLHAAFGRKYLDKDEYERLVEMTQSIGRMLRVLEQRLRAPRPTVVPGTRTPPGT